MGAVLYKTAPSSGSWYFRNREIAQITASAESPPPPALGDLLVQLSGAVKSRAAAETLLPILTAVLGAVQSRAAVEWETAPALLLEIVTFADAATSPAALYCCVQLSKLFYPEFNESLIANGIASLLGTVLHDRGASAVPALLLLASLIHSHPGVVREAVDVLPILLPFIESRSVIFIEAVLNVLISYTAEFEIDAGGLFPIFNAIARAVQSEQTIRLVGELVISTLKKAATSIDLMIDSEILCLLPLALSSRPTTSIDLEVYECFRQVLLVLRRSSKPFASTPRNVARHLRESAVEISKEISEQRFLDFLRQPDLTGAQRAMALSLFAERLRLCPNLLQTRVTDMILESCVHALADGTFELKLASLSVCLIAVVSGTPDNCRDLMNYGLLEGLADVLAHDLGPKCSRKAIDALAALVFKMDGSGDDVRAKLADVGVVDGIRNITESDAPDWLILRAENVLARIGVEGNEMSDCDSDFSDS
jgi:hypothetical protein